MKSLLSLSVMVPSKSVKKINFGSLNGKFIALRLEAAAMMKAKEVKSEN